MALWMRQGSKPGGPRLRQQARFTRARPRTARGAKKCSRYQKEDRRQQAISSEVRYCAISWWGDDNSGKATDTGATGQLSGTSGHSCSDSPTRRRIPKGRAGFDAVWAPRQASILGPMPTDGNSSNRTLSQCVSASHRSRSVSNSWHAAQSLKADRSGYREWPSSTQAYRGSPRRDGGKPRISCDAVCTGDDRDRVPDQPASRKPRRGCFEGGRCCRQEARLMPSCDLPRSRAEAPRGHQVGARPRSKVVGGGGPGMRRVRAHAIPRPSRSVCSEKSE